ncbi:hypothetical protein BHE74_00043127 [Ensete ventricosum]|nr:hypothetical protein BHE74_00043127 [Ensete ventricosum]
MGGTYRSARLPIRGPPATSRFRQKSTVDSRLKKKSTVDGRLREKSTVGDRLRKKKGRGKEKKRRGKERIPRPPVVAARGSPTATAAFSPARRDGASPRAGRKIEATSKVRSEC